VRIPEQSYHPFRFIVTTDSAALLPVIPEHCDHPFRWIVTTLTDNLRRR